MVNNSNVPNYPLTENYQSRSPYNYVIDNPLKYVDPTGMEGEYIYDQLKDGTYKKREGVKNDGGDKFHTFINKDGSTTYVDLRKGTVAKIDKKEEKNTGVTYTLGGVFATPVGGLSFNVGMVYDEKGSGLVASGGIAVGFDLSIGFEITDTYSSGGKKIFMKDVRGESRSTNGSFIVFDYGEGGDHCGSSSNIFDREGTMQSYTTGVSVSPFLIGGSRQVEQTFTSLRFKYK